MLPDNTGGCQYACTRPNAVQLSWHLSACRALLNSLIMQHYTQQPQRDHRSASTVDNCRQADCCVQQLLLTWAISGLLASRDTLHVCCLLCMCRVHLTQMAPAPTHSCEQNIPCSIKPGTGTQARARITHHCSPCSSFTFVSPAYWHGHNSTSTQASPPQATDCCYLFPNGVTMLIQAHPRHSTPCAQLAMTP